MREMFVINSIRSGLVVFISILLALAITKVMAIFGDSRQPDGKQSPKPIVEKVKLECRDVGMRKRG